MKTTIKEENNNQVVYFEGRLDTSASSQVQVDVQPVMDNVKSDIILDCNKLEYICWCNNWISYIRFRLATYV